MVKRNMTIILSVLLSAFIAHSAYAKPAPPEKLEGIFENLSELEESFEAGEWDEATAMLDEISGAFKELLPEMKKDVKGKIIDDFNFILSNLRKSIADKNGENTLKNYIKVQELFFDIMDVYEYRIHPILKVIDRYLDEAAEAIEENDFEDVVGEMEEIGEFFEKSESILQQKGISKKDLDDFGQKIRETRISGEAKNREQVVKHITELKRMFSAFLEAF